MAALTKMYDWFLKNEFVDERIQGSLWEAIRQAANLLVIELSRPEARNPASVTVKSDDREYIIEVHRKK